MIEFGNVAHGMQLAAKMKTVFNSNVETVVSRSEHGVLYGGVIYENYTGTSVSMHVAGVRRDWLNRDLLYLAFAYPFYQLHVKVIIGRVDTPNKKAMKFDFHVGFKPVYTIKDAVPGGDVIVLEMRKDDCKWLKMPPKHYVHIVDHKRKAA